ncbi:MAG: hypothetical protein CMJ83_12765 [Planctomycetes bacterium]|nr:hypothetical protein [Planctomycetota bacterium]
MVLLGLVLGAAGILFCSRVYNPFGDSVESPLVLIPDDMDFVVYVPDFPTFMGEVRERDFVTALDGHPGFQGFLKTKGARESGLVDTLRKVFRSLDDAAGRVPLGLELMGDVSGTEVIVAGYFPEKKDGELRFMAVFQPGAWKTIAGVNILLDETLCDWFVSDALEAEGIGIEHRRDQVKLAFPDWNQDLWITRIADTVLVSTEERQLARIHGAVLKDGLPESPAPRYFPLQNASGDFHAQVLARRRKADTYLELEKQLLDLWGPEDLDLVEATLPRVGSVDMVVELHIGSGIGVALSGGLGDQKEDDVSAVLEPFTKDDLEEVMDGYRRFLPKEVFGILHLHAPLGRLTQRLFSREDIFPFEEQKLLDDYLASTPVFGSRVAFFETLSRHSESATSIVFFTQPREMFSDQAKPGYAVVVRAKDIEGLKRLLARLQREIVQTNGEGPVTQLFHETKGGVELYKPVLQANVIDDPRVTIPGLAIADGHLLISNFYPMLKVLPEVLAGTHPSMKDHDGFQSALSYAPDDLLLAGLLDHDRLEPYLDQSVSGWAHQHSTPTNDDFEQWIIEGRNLGVKQDMKPGPELEGFADRYRNRKHEAAIQVELPRRRAEARRHVDYFRGLLTSTGFFVEIQGGEVKIQLRIDPKHQGQ